MKLIFAGTPEFAAHALQALIAAGHEIALVLTQPDRPAGRGMSLQPSAVKHVALLHGLPLFQPERLKDPTTHAPIRAVQAELMVVVAYGLILPQAVLDIPPRGCINIHASLLPRWRGAAPIHRAIEAGDAQTGVTLMQMDAGLDTGPMLAMQAIAIGADETTGQLHHRLAQLGGEMIVAALAQPDSLAPQPQAEAGVTYANKIGKSEAQLDWRQPAAVLARKIRAFDPFPGASLVLADQPVKVWRAVALATPNRAAPGEISSADASGIVVACGEGALRLLELQKPGGRRLASADFLRGHPLCKPA
ncbi:MAG TPA: methionyl-tRNA formyltransferase [Rhodocyclaceae bacterium]|nr:methionyl-tRNA formyltransferase [Rhodocyclaceae bacterium]